MDCPYWEQLQYLGDTRIQALLTYVTSRDVRLPEKALDIFQYSMMGASPFPASNYPSGKVQIIPPPSRSGGSACCTITRSGGATRGS